MDIHKISNKFLIYTQVSISTFTAYFGFIIIYFIKIYLKNQKETLFPVS